MKTVITNFRVDENTYEMVKILAAELGVSVNEYLKVAVARLNKDVQLKPHLGNDHDPIWDLPKLAVKFKPKNKITWSKDDQAIYGH
ncbi:MAG TPA: hypothetical protein VI791_00175 [Patescibacteria group bacterium]|nr:hypothetical protein [Patescibacteria group bacterium]